MFITPLRYTIRPAAPGDHEALRRLAALDSQSEISGDVLLAEIEGRIAAAISLATGRVIADPFLHTAGFVDALRTTRANHLRRRTAPSLRERIVATLLPAAPAGARA
jgi:hypothetical protein